MRSGLRLKYRNKPTVIDGIRFDSKAEARRYTELQLMERGGVITNLRRQVRYPLDVNGVVIGHYIADFTYAEITHRPPHPIVVEDVKGVRTALYRWKAKHMKAQYGIEVREVA